MFIDTDNYLKLLRPGWGEMFIATAVHKFG
jgi:hypothetical protein